MTKRRSKRGGVRPGSGRPPVTGTARSVLRTLKLTPAEAATQDEAATRAGQLWPDWIRTAAERALAESKSKDRDTEIRGLLDGVPEMTEDERARQRASYAAGDVRIDAESGPARE